MNMLMYFAYMEVFWVPRIASDINIVWKIQSEIQSSKWLVLVDISKSDVFELEDAFQKPRWSAPADDGWSAQGIGLDLSQS